MGLPILAGVLFDRSGSYTVVLWIILSLWVVAGVLLVLTPRYSYAPQASAPATAAALTADD
jgi:hypothetical protein